MQADQMKRSHCHCFIELLEDFKINLVMIMEFQRNYYQYCSLRYPISEVRLLKTNLAYQTQNQSLIKQLVFTLLII
jgi:hypothetical protein